MAIKAQYARINRAKRRNPLPSVECAVCHSTFIPSNKNQRVCSTEACRNKRRRLYPQKDYHKKKEFCTCCGNKIDGAGHSWCKKCTADYSRFRRATDPVFAQSSRTASAKFRENNREHYRQMILDGYYRMQDRKSKGLPSERLSRMATEPEFVGLTASLM